MDSASTDVSGRLWTPYRLFRKQQAVGSNPTAGSLTNPDFEANLRSIDRAALQDTSSPFGDLTAKLAGAHHCRVCRTLVGIIVLEFWRNRPRPTNADPGMLRRIEFQRIQKSYFHRITYPSRSWMHVGSRSIPTPVPIAVREQVITYACHLRGARRASCSAGPHPPSSPLSTAPSGCLPAPPAAWRGSPPCRGGCAAASSRQSS